VQLHADGVRKVAAAAGATETAAAEATAHKWSVTGVMCMASSAVTTAVFMLLLV
jgi:hypothetical protein